MWAVKTKDHLVNLTAQDLLENFTPKFKDLDEREDIDLLVSQSLEIAVASDTLKDATIATLCKTFFNLGYAYKLFLVNNKAEYLGKESRTDNSNR